MLILPFTHTDSSLMTFKLCIKFAHHRCTSNHQSGPFVASLRSHVTHETDMTQSMRLWPLAQHRTRCPEGHGVHGRLSMLRFYNGRLCVRQTEPSSEPVTSDRTVQKEENDMRPYALRQRVCRQLCISINRLMWARARQILISFFPNGM